MKSIMLLVALSCIGCGGSSTQPVVSSETESNAQGSGLDQAAAQSTLREGAEAAKNSKADGGPTGTAHVTVKFAPTTGLALSAVVKGPPFAGTSVGSCIAGSFRTARVPPFDGPPASVDTTVVID